MFNPVRSYKQYVQRLENKRKVFNPDKKTLDLQELNRFVNGTPEQPRTKPTYLLTKTRQLLKHTLEEGIEAGDYVGERDWAAQNLLSWCLSPRNEPNTGVRRWLKQLTNVKPVERKADEPQGPDCVARSDAEGRGSSHQQSAPIDGDIVAKDDKAFAMSVEGLDPEDPPELHAADSDAALRQWVDALDVSEHKNNPHDLFNRVDKRIANRGRRPAPMLRPSKSTQSPDHTVMRAVGAQIVPAKQ